MIVADEPIFPNNVVSLAKMAFQAIDSDLSVFTRPLRNTDPRQSIGVFGQMWTPDEQSMEMYGFNPGEPTLQTYMIGVQAFIKHTDEELGLAVHSILSNRVRSVLYRSESFRVALTSLSAEDAGVTESMRRWGVRTQRYFSNEIDAEWLYLSTLEFWIETEIR